jgi:CRISPR type I-E-associated protein CasB/Cse2
MSPDSIVSPPTRAARFLNGLRKIQDDRGKMASLRHAASPRRAMGAWPIVAALGEDIRSTTAIAIATLFASHPMESGLQNFGETCRTIALKDSSDGKIPDSFIRRFRRLLACETSEEVVEQARAWVRFASAKSVGIPYERLFNDLAYWHKDSGQIRLKWAAGFWPPTRDAELPVAENEQQ